MYLAWLRYGPIVRCDIPPPRSGSAHDSVYAFVEYEDARDAGSAITARLDAVRVQTSVNVGMYPVESMMHAIHTHARVMRELSALSREIVESVCCKESRLSEFEQARGWREGYGMIRLREALDELVEAFRLLGKANR